MEKMPTNPFISSPFMLDSMTYCIGMGMASEGSILSSGPKAR